MGNKDCKSHKVVSGDKLPIWNGNFGPFVQLRIFFPILLKCATFEGRLFIFYILQNNRKIRVYLHCSGPQIKEDESEIRLLIALFRIKVG